MIMFCPLIRAVLKQITSNSSLKYRFPEGRQELPKLPIPYSLQHCGGSVSVYQIMSQ